jgi:hypothetical protein
MTYEQLLDADGEWAMSEGSRYFEEGGAVQVSLRKIARRLQDLGIPYAIAGGMALFAHGFRRFTEDVDLLVTGEGLKQIHRELEGAGYRPVFPGSKNLRDAESGVRIEFLVTGQFPGDGKPKPVAFPSPDPVSLERDGIRYLNLPTLIELKLASGMTSPQRVKDLADVQELIKLLRLPEDWAVQLNAYVRPRYVELWKAAQSPARRFLRLWTYNLSTLEAQSLEEMAAGRHETAAILSAMMADGVTLERTGATGDEYAYLVTTDPVIARKYDMHEESEFLP